MQLSELVEHLNDFLSIHTMGDAALNGLQVENTGKVSRVGLAVDASLEEIQLAAEEGCDLLIVHHGLFWTQAIPITQNTFKRIRALIQADMALYAAHLPLDAHPEVGNNAQIAKRLGLTGTLPFGHYQGKAIGIQGTLPKPVSLEEALSACNKKIGPATAAFLEGPDRVSIVGIVTGSATDSALFQETVENGIDLLITGEPKHVAYALSREFGLNLYYGGHYRTETFGVQALGTHIEKEYKLPTHFVETGCPL